MSGKSVLRDDEYDELLKPMARELSAMARWKIGRASCRERV